MEDALTHAFAAGVAGNIWVQAWLCDDDCVRLVVSDDGCGIPAKQQRRVFDPFFTTKEVGKGTGLGLAVTYALVHRYEGEINVRSRPGQGAVFTVLLPRVGGCLQTTGKE